MGIARKANLIGVKVMDCSGNTDTASILQGISYIEGKISSYLVALILVNHINNSNNLQT